MIEIEGAGINFEGVLVYLVVFFRFGFCDFSRCIEIFGGDWCRCLLVFGSWEARGLETRWCRIGICYGDIVRGYRGFDLEWR